MFSIRSLTSMKTQPLHFFTEDPEMAGIRLTFTTNATIKEEL